MTNLQAIQLLHRSLLNLAKADQALDILTLTSEEGNNMIDPKVAALITQFDEATNKIAARIQGLIDAGGLNAESQAALAAEVTKLQALGADPANPVPPAA